MADIQWVGLKELVRAIERSPQSVLNEGRTFLTKGLAVYKRGIINRPWRIGGAGGGAPVSNDTRYPRKYQRQRSGNLRDTHITRVTGLIGTIGPNMQSAPYALYVHEGTRRMQGRPWLEYVKNDSNPEIEDLYRYMLQNIVTDLAK